VLTGMDPETIEPAAAADAERDHLEA
jgi:hypothetical protein